ncbi:7SK snRNA methylphosphate capping enzyme bin3 [Topomyia yanbarensis]|uniref:7SK snRNA methylphosphate capping enzyme bin3 n=1 Tax=Topomyia yanbarensis TaxID=2498891 RepID=UPI00273ABA1F|nr:7SK snRNA methylphosphate capping enzyme bin3 [Topomyia yanbarensis]
MDGRGVVVSHGMLVEGEGGGGEGGEISGVEHHAFAAVRGEGNDGRNTDGKNQKQQQLPRPQCNKKQNKHFSRHQGKNKKWLNKFRRNQKDCGGKKKDMQKGSECSLGGGKGDEKQNQSSGNVDIKLQQSGGKNKHSNKNSNSLMQVRTKRLQAVSKFFLPDKRPRKDCIIPPTKFLLGGNISDPLNLNSLQNESENAVTPKSSPIPTPPHYKNKIEVIIPPNINDPLHLLDPVDSVEYEMQLCSPMKKKQRARNKRKRKSKSDKNNQSWDSNTGNGSGQLGTSLSETEATTAEEAQIEAPTGTISKDVEHTLESGNTGDRDKANRNLKLDLEICRKRRISESTCASKNKVRRMDSMDKIVSPVVPQPGAWKRGHWPTLPVGGRNRTRTQSCTSNSDEPPTKQIAFESDLNVENIQASVVAHQEMDKEHPKSPAVEPNSKSKSQNDTKYHYGNYDRYYGYRNLNEFIDVRLKVFLRNPYLFRDKDVLDIGCNVGLMTIAVAKMLHTKSITGIDIDSKLIAKARRNLTTHVRVPSEHVKVKKEGNKSGHKESKPHSTGEEKTIPEKDTPKESKSLTDEKKPAVEEDAPEQQLIAECSKKLRQKGKQINRRKFIGNRHGHGHGRSHHHHNQQQKKDPRKGKAEYFPISFPLSLSNLGAKKCRLDVGLPDRFFPGNVVFKTMNYVLKDESLINYDTQQYDLILCLSVTKWIHLNFGDCGLKIAFKRMFNHLRPGGKLILEAQNWASYKKKKKLTDTIFENYKNIEFFPNRFHDFLLSPEVGFSHSYPLGIPRHLSKGFRRPIQLYIKGDFTPSQAQWSDTYHPQTPYVNHSNIYSDIATPTRNNCIWGSTTPYQPSYSTRCTPSHGFMATSPYYNPRQTDSYQPSYGAGTRRGSYCFASPLYSTTWSPPSDLCHRRSASNTPNSASIRSAENDENFNAQQNRPHVYPPMEVFSLETSGRLQAPGSVRQTDSDSEVSSNSASQTPTRPQFDNDQSSNSPSTTHSQPDK